MSKYDPSIQANVQAFSNYWTNRIYLMVSKDLSDSLKVLMLQHLNTDSKLQALLLTLMSARYAERGTEEEDRDATRTAADMVSKHIWPCSMGISYTLAHELGAADWMTHGL
jgi:hypothetical protein